VKICRATREGTLLIEAVEMATGFRDRLKGLLGRGGMERGKAIYLSPCGSIHTFFMKFPIDVVFLDGSMVVLRIFRGVKPFRLVWGGLSAAAALEMETGWLPAEALRVGDRLNLSSPQ